jgi:hypothetical protein
VRDEAAQRRLAAVPFENGRHTVPVAAMHRKRLKLPPDLLQFIEFLKLPKPGEIPSLAGAVDSNHLGTRIMVTNHAHGFHRLPDKKSGPIAWPGFHF